MSTELNAAEKLKKAAEQAYAKYPHSCSHAVWYVIKQYQPQQPYYTANVLLEHLECNPKWKPVQHLELTKLAKAGVLVVGGLKDSPNGHVIVVYPGSGKPAGGYLYNSGGSMKMMRSRGMYALAMSTSLGRWPGAKSNGDKTVWDPWANDAKFEKVKFWRLDLEEKGSVGKCEKKLI